MFTDWCPLCATRFKGRSPKVVYTQILEHSTNGFCQRHFVPMAQALRDNSYKAFDTGRIYPLPNQKQEGE